MPQLLSRSSHALWAIRALQNAFDKVSASPLRQRRLGACDNCRPEGSDPPRKSRSLARNARSTSRRDEAHVDHEIRAVGELDLASGDIRIVRHEDYDITTQGVPAHHKGYVFSQPPGAVTKH